MNKWPMIPLTDMLTLQRRWIEVDPFATYGEIGIRCFGKGIFHKPAVEGVVLGNKRVLRIEPNDLVFNNVFAWEGAVAVAGPEDEGKIGSHRFVTYTVNPKLASPQFLQLFFTTERGLDVLKKASPGSAGRNKTLGLERFISQSICIPPQSKQKKIAEWINALATRVEEVKTLIGETTQEIDDLSRSILWANEKVSTPTPMSELVEQRTPDVEVSLRDTYSFAGVYCFGRGVFAGQTKTGMDFKYPKLTRLKASNFVYPKLMAWEGAFGVVPPECDGLVVSTEFPVFEIDESKVLPEVLDVYFKTPSVWPQVAGASTGTNVRRRRLNPKDFLKYEFPLPAMPIQRQIRDVRVLTEQAKQERQETKHELDAIVKSMLNEVFNGSTS